MAGSSQGSPSSGLHLGLNAVPVTEMAPARFARGCVSAGLCFSSV